MTIEITTHGKFIIHQPDFCSYCNLSTGGNHELHCPLYKGVRYYVTITNT